MLTLNELTLATAGLLWLWFLILAAGQVRHDWARGLRPYKTLLGVLAVLALAWLGIVLRIRMGTSVAVVINPEAVVRYGPFEEAQTSYTARDGTELTVLDRKDSWYQVSDPAKRTGWLQTKDVVLLPRG